MKLLLAVREKNHDWESDSKVPRTTNRLLVREVDWPKIPKPEVLCILGQDEKGEKHITSCRWVGKRSIVHNFVGEVIEVTLEPLITEDFDALREGDNGWHLQGGRSED